MLKLRSIARVSEQNNKLCETVFATLERVYWKLSIINYSSSSEQ